MTDSIDWLVFDLGGVLVDVAPPADTLTDLAARSDTAVERLAPLLRERFTARPFSLAERFQVGELDARAFHAASPVALVMSIAVAQASAIARAA